MANAFDNRLMTFQINLDGNIYTYDQRYDISAVGTRYSNENTGECTIRVSNMSYAARNDIITKTTPWQTNGRAIGQCVLSVGRESTGTFVVFQGAMVAAQITQPPDIGLILRSATGVQTLGQAGSLVMPPVTTLYAICQQVVANLNAAAPEFPVTLDFQSSQGSKQISNFSVTGSVWQQVVKLNELLPGVLCYQEIDRFVVVDVGTPLNSGPIEINANTGMVGVPEITDYGVKVTTLIQNEIKMFSPVNITSKLNPMANGTFYVNQMQFEVASRQDPFYWQLFCRKQQLTPQ